MMCWGIKLQSSGDKIYIEWACFGKTYYYYYYMNSAARYVRIRCNPVVGVRHNIIYHRNRNNR